MRVLGIVILSLTILFTSMSSIHAFSKVDYLDYRVTRSDYTFSTVFDMANEKYPVGSIVKSVFHIVTHYDSYDLYGLYEGQGICRLLNLGSLYNWIDVYNAKGDQIGCIGSQLKFSDSAQFSFYDPDGNRLCLAYLDQNEMAYSLVDPTNTEIVLAHLKHHFSQGSTEYWDVSIYDPAKLPPKLVKIFAAYLCDNQAKPEDNSR